jgi:tRNA (guanosine-2'-O-)-methyltransferase
MTLEEDVLNRMYALVSDEKIEMFDTNAAKRTNHLTVVLENIYQEHNASAVLRTCDCFGIQNLHTIEKNNKYTVQRDIARGAGNWVDLNNYNSNAPTKTCLEALKSKGYVIIATTPHENEVNLKELPLDAPMAFVFGTEKEGISQEVKDNADYFVKIPMYGFTESFNISVSVALILQYMRNKLMDNDIPFILSEAEQTAVKIKWCTKILKDGNKVEVEIRKRILEKKK